MFHYASLHFPAFLDISLFSLLAAFAGHTLYFWVIHNICHLFLCHVRGQRLCHTQTFQSKSISLSAIKYRSLMKPSENALSAAFSNS